MEAKAVVHVAVVVDGVKRPVEVRRERTLLVDVETEPTEAGDQLAALIEQTKAEALQIVRSMGRLRTIERELSAA